MSGLHASPPGSGAPPSRRRLRLLVGIALAFLLLDALLLVLAGILTRTLLPFLLAVVALLLGFGVVVLERRFTRRWEAITADRRELRAEVQSWLDQRRGS